MNWFSSPRAPEIKTVIYKTESVVKWWVGSWDAQGPGFKFRPMEAWQHFYTNSLLLLLMKLPDSP